MENQNITYTNTCLMPESCLHLFWLQDEKLNEYSIFHGAHILKYFVTNTLARTHVKGL